MLKCHTAVRITTKLLIAEIRSPSSLERIVADGMRLMLTRLLLLYFFSVASQLTP